MNYWRVLKKTICIGLLTLFFSEIVDSLTDQCAGRCDNQHFCEKSTQACEPCGVFCDLTSSRADPDACQSHCPYIIYGTNKTRDCPQTCEPGYYCEKELKTCENCQMILCDPKNQIYTKECPEICSVEPVTPSQESDFNENLIKTVGKTTGAGQNEKLKVKNKNRDIMIVSVCVGAPCAVGIIVLTIYLVKKYRGRRPKYSVQATTESMGQQMVILSMEVNH